MASEVEVKKSILRDETVWVKPVKRTSWLPAGHDGHYRFTGCSVMLCPQANSRTGVLETGLSKEEEEQLEKEMRLTAGTLNRYNKDFWGNHKNYPLVPKDGLELNLNIPMHYLHYKLCLANTLVANSEVELPESPKAEFYLASPKDEAKAQNIKDKKEREAATLYGKLTSSEKVNILKAYALLENRKTGRPSKDWTLDTIDTELYKRVKTNPEEFVRIASNSSLATMIFIDDLVSARILSVVGSKYTPVGADRPLGITLEDTIAYLEDPRNQDVFVALKGKLDAVK